MKVDINRTVFKQQIYAFDASLSAKKICVKSEKLTKSQGKAIDSINDCMKAYDALCNAINDLYSSTSAYLHTASNNFDACEKANMKK